METNNSVRPMIKSNETEDYHYNLKNVTRLRYELNDFFNFPITDPYFQTFAKDVICTPYYPLLNETT